MFESDDFDQVLSQFDFPGLPSIENNKSSVNTVNELDDKVDEGFSPTQALEAAEIIEIELPESDVIRQNANSDLVQNTVKTQVTKTFSCNQNVWKDNLISPKHTKRKIINTHFDHKSKRKFPGPAGLLTGTLEQNKDETISRMELLSQDLEFSEHNSKGELFESPLWLRLLEDMQSWNLLNRDSIKSIKEQALAGNLRRRKAETVTAFVETIDRSGTDPLIVLRDPTGHIKCTLHRDAWSNFSNYIIAEYCALVLWKPTVLTTGGAFKKHYLNITLRNIYAIYSSTVLDKDERIIPKDYIAVSEDDFTVIKTGNTPKDLGTNLSASNEHNGVSEDNNLLDDLDSIFSDDLF